MKSILSVATGALCLFASSVVASSETRNIAIKELNRIQDLAENLTRSIQGWDGTLQYALYNIDSPATDTSAYLMNATAELKKYPTTFSITDAFLIGGQTQNLAYAVNASVAALIKQVQPFTKALIAEIAIGDLQMLLNATQIYSDLLITYVSEQLRPVALALQTQALGSLKQGLDCYNNINDTMLCNSAVVNPNTTHEMALRWGAIRPNGYPIA